MPSKEVHGVHARLAELHSEVGHPEDHGADSEVGQRRATVRGQVTLLFLSVNKRMREHAYTHPHRVS